MTPRDFFLHADGGTFCLRALHDTAAPESSGDAAGLLQLAVDRLAEAGGGRIDLGSGEFPLGRTVRLRSGVGVFGRGRSTRLRVADGLEAAIELERADGVELRDFVLACRTPAGARTGVVVSDSGDFRLADVHAKNFAAHGFHIRNNAFLGELRGCKAWECGEAGFCLRDLRENGRGGEFVPNLLLGCVAVGGGDGFALHQALVVNLVGCQVFQATGHGFHLTRESNSVGLTGCRTFHVGGDAYRAEEANEICLSGNIFCWHRGNGIVLRKVTWGAIAGNEIIDNGVRTADGSLRCGVRLSEGCRGLQISGNAIFNWADQCPMESGIVEDDTCLANNISNNNINYFRHSGLVAKGQDTTAVHNTCTGNWFMWDPTKPYPDFSRDPIETFMRGHFAQGDH